MRPLSSSSANPRFNDPFISTLDSAAPINAKDDPNYYSRYPRSLITTSSPQNFMTGTGSAIYNALTPLLESAHSELILVTCFWARSATLDGLAHILRALSDKAIRRGTDKIRVRLCFSSSSVLQKLFHKQSVTGQIYPASTWIRKLGLPDPSELGGLDVRIKSIFLLPFSVMHPKFIIIDRMTVVLPSCNISWEEWFEGAITMTGSVVQQFLNFYSNFWERRQEEPPLPINQGDQAHRPGTSDDLINSNEAEKLLKSSVKLTSSEVHTVFLPSPHRRNPAFRVFGSQSDVLAPPTPLNIFLLTLFAKAEKSIRIQTPNITAPPVLSALLRALARGVDVQILTSSRLMVLEQVVTAGTTTSRCINKLIKRYKKLSPSGSRRPMSDEEAVISTPKPGRLHIAYFDPINGLKKRGHEDGEPQQSHLKLTIVDDEVLVLGSGNLDRASWFTSQELGVAFFSKEITTKVAAAVDQGMQGRSRIVFDA